MALRKQLWGRGRSQEQSYFLGTSWLEGNQHDGEMLSLEVKRTEADVMQSVRKNRSSNGHLALQNQEKH